MINRKSLISAIIVTLILGAIGYFVGDAMERDGMTLAIGIVLGGILASIVGSRSSNPSDAGDDDNDEVHVATGDEVTLFVGNLTHKTRRHQLQELFEPYGSVMSVRIAQDRATRRSRGFGFVVMNKAGAEAAMKAINGKNFYGRMLKVSVAKEQKLERAA